ncbi:hypothetical protein [Nocardioides sp. 616]|uniref:hypothetical protein n=1 Tax=Nocardioides sp. 616 TaxID=2268090 RepID=UPI000CE546B0|nr:hypothetical protein [Nocardioides sp. 616]
MSAIHPTPDLITDQGTIGLRTRAGVALALGMLGLMGGGLFAQALQWIFIDVFTDVGWIQAAVTSAAVPAALGAAATVLGHAASQDQDPVSLLLGRIARVLGLLTLLGSALLLVAVAINYA